MSEYMHTDIHNKRPSLSPTGKAIIGGVAIAGAISANLFTAKVDSVSESNEPLVTPDSIHEIVDKGPDDEFIRSEIIEGQATSIAVEQSVLDLAAIDNLGLNSLQNGASQESAKYISTKVYELTKGSVQPGQEITTWRDDSTGLIVSTLSK